MGEEKPTFGGAVVNASPDIAYSVVSSAIGAVLSGDVNLRRPDQPVGVRAEIKDELRAKLTSVRKIKRVFTYRSTKGPIESANIKLLCEVQYNGPEVLAHFYLAADGMRSRLGTTTTIEISNPLSLERRPAPDAWKKGGIPLVPVVYVPVSIFVDEPGPVKNYKATFDVVVSGLAGLGITGDADGIENRKEVKD